MRQYSIYDPLAHEFDFPFSAKNDDVAVRSIKRLLAQSVGVAVSDYELYHVGDFNQETGALEPLDPIVQVDIAFLFKDLKQGAKNATPV